MRDPASSFARYLRARYSSTQTISTYERVALSFERWRAERGLERAQTTVEAFVGRLGRQGAPRAPSTRNRELMALRVYFAHGERELGWERASLDSIPPVRAELRDPPVPSTGEIFAFFQKLGETSDARLRARNLAIVGVLVLAGLRVHELVALDVDQVDLEGRTLLAVRGKRGTIHDVVVNDALAQLLRRWIGLRGSSGRGPLFIGHRSSERLSVRAIEDLVARTRRSLGLRRQITPHSFRHAFATQSLARGTDLATVASLMRHQNIASTRRYLHLDDRMRRTAAERLSALVPQGILEQPTPPPTTRTIASGEVDPPCEESQFLASSPEKERAQLSQETPQSFCGVFHARCSTVGRVVAHGRSRARRNSRPMQAPTTSVTFVLSLAILLVLTACNPIQVFRSTTSVATLRTRAVAGQRAGSFEQEHDGIRIEVRPITPETVNQHAAVRPAFTFGQVWRNPLNGQMESAGSRTERYAIVPYGTSFAVKVTNNTGHALRFTSAIIRMQDQAGRSLPVIGSTQELLAWIQPQFAPVMATTPDLQSQLSQAVSGLMLFSRSLELLDRDEWRGYLIFNGFASNPSYTSFMGRVERLTLRIAEVPVATNEAGAVARTAEFSFVFDKSSYEQETECRGTSPEDRSNCTWALDPAPASSGTAQ